MFETRSHAWSEAGLARQLSAAAVRWARVRLLTFTVVLAGVLVLYSYRDEIFGSDMPVRIGTAVVLLVLGWWITRDVGRAFAPIVFRRMDPATAGTVGFLVRLVAVLVVLVVSLGLAGIHPRTLAVGGALTAIIAGLAAQQTLGNLFAGLVLVSAHPFRVGDRIRVQGAGLNHEGVVSSLGLLFTSLDQGEDTIVIPNSLVLSVAVTPLREPEGVDLRARVPLGMTPSQIDTLLREGVATPLRSHPEVHLEELDGDEIVVRIVVVPARPQDGVGLAEEVLELLAREAARTSARADSEPSVPS
jgi:small-conductance mechanosensitive channel